MPSGADKKAGAEKEYSFLEAPPKDFFCPVMFSLLLEPHQTSCCGKHLSAEAASKISESCGRCRCPICKKEEFSSTLDKHFQRQVRGFLVFCPYRMRGCGFVAEISEMERHILQCSHKNSRITSKPLGMFASVVERLKCMCSASGLRVLRSSGAARTDCTHSCSSLCLADTDWQTLMQRTK